MRREKGKDIYSKSKQVICSSSVVGCTFGIGAHVCVCGVQSCWCIRHVRWPFKSWPSSCWCSLRRFRTLHVWLLGSHGPNRKGFTACVHQSQAASTAVSGFEASASQTRTGEHVLAKCYSTGLAVASAVHELHIKTVMC